MGFYDEIQSSILNPSNLSSFFGSSNELENTLSGESLLICRPRSEAYTENAVGSYYQKRKAKCGCHSSQIIGQHLMHEIV